MSQARETTSIYANILDSTMETYASIINNGVSAVMRQMTSWTVLLMFPTLIASIFGMNLVNGMEQWAGGFPLVIIVSIVISVVIYYFFRRIDWL